MLANFAVTETDNFPTILPLSSIRRIFENQKSYEFEEKKSVLTILNFLNSFLQSGLEGEKIVKTIFLEKRFELNFDSVSNYEVLFYTYTMMCSEESKTQSFQLFIENIKEINESVINNIRRDEPINISEEKNKYMKRFIESLDIAYSKIIK